MFSEAAYPVYSARAVAKAIHRFDTINLPERSDSDFSLYDEDDGGRAGKAGSASAHVQEAKQSLANLQAHQPPSIGVASSAAAQAPVVQKASSASRIVPPKQSQDEAPEGKGIKLGASKLQFHDAKADSFVVRCGPNYAKNGNKLPSLEALYEVCAVESIASKTAKIGDAAHLFNLPRVQGDLATSLKIPRLFICNVQLPSKASIFSSGPPDPGTSLVYIFKLRPNFPADCPAVKLLQQFQANKLKGRFKVIGYVDNMKELGVPSMVAGFNGRPFIVEKTGVFHRRDDYLCVDVDVHQFPILARKTLVSMRGTLPKAVLRCGFVLQGETDDELPERLLGAAVVSGLDLESVLYV